MKQLSKNELKEVIRKHQLWTIGRQGGVRADLSYTNLIGANLTHVDLSGANLTGANLTRANLTNIDLSGADLTRANLYRANLTRAVIANADLSCAKLSYANLTRANLYRANLYRANLYRANLYDTDLTETDLTEADLTEANMGKHKTIELRYDRDGELVSFERSVTTTFHLSKNTMINQIIQDKYNSIKMWIVTKSTSGHYGLMQMIDGVVISNSPRYGKANIIKTLSFATIE